MTRPAMHPLRLAGVRLQHAARVAGTLGLLAEQNLGEPSGAQLEYVAILIGEALEGVQECADRSAIPAGVYEDSKGHWHERSSTYAPGEIGF